MIVAPLKGCDDVALIRAVVARKCEGLAVVSQV